MTAAIDFGGYKVRVLNCTDGRLVARSFRSVYSVLADSHEQRALLDRLDVPFAVCDSHLVVIGDHAETVRCVNPTPLISIISGGKIAANDPPSRQILNLLTETMLQSADGQETCAVVTPGTFADDTSRAFLNQLVSFRKYAPLQISPGNALVLAEGSESRFSALGISFGAECCDLSLVLRGAEIDRAVVEKGGAWIDRELALQSRQFIYDREGHCYLDTGAVAEWKHAPLRSLSRRDSGPDHALSSLYDEMLTDVVTAIEGLIGRNQIGSGPLPILCAGGTTGIDGFRETFRRLLQAGECSAFISGVQIVDDEYAIARGGLIKAELQNEVKSSAA